MDSTRSMRLLLLLLPFSALTMLLLGFGSSGAAVPPPIALSSLLKQRDLALEHIATALAKSAGTAVDHQQIREAAVTEYLSEHMVTFVPMNRSSGPEAVNVCHARRQSLCTQSQLVAARLRGGYRHCARGWIRNPPNKPTYRVALKEKGMGRIDGDHQWYVVVPDAVTGEHSKCDQPGFKYLRRDAVYWDDSAPHVLYISPIKDADADIPQDDVGAYCCGALPASYNQSCSRGDLSPAVLYSSLFAMQKVFLKHGLMPVPVWGTLLMMFRDRKLQVNRNYY